MRRVFAAEFVDGVGNDDRRTARIIAAITTTILNAARRNGVDIPDTMYRSENDYMPSFSRPKRKRLKPQSFGEMKKALGFT